jgi:manganese/zinc/iron transport system permease protein
VTEVFSLLSDFTIRNVMLGAAMLGVASGVLGSFAVLRQQSLLGDALSHAALPGVALGFLVAGGRQLLPILTGALLTGALAALFMLLLTRYSRLKTDAALGAALSIFFAMGIVLLTYIGNQNNAGQAGLEAFLFGQAASIVPSDLVVMGSITGVSLLIVLLFWKEFKVASFDPEFATSLGLPVVALELGMTVMVALAIVVGLQMVGVVLMAAMIVAPAAAARQWSRGLGGMVLLSGTFGALSGITGALISATGRGLATGPLIIIAASVIVAVSLLFAPQRGLLWLALRNAQTGRTLQSQQILVDLYTLAQTHNDPAYPVEGSMIDSYYGLNTRRALASLEHKGFIEGAEHMREEGQHWTLTPHGFEQAETILANLGRHD